MLTHNLGLSLLIAPAYRLGGLAGVEYFLAFLGACLAANIFALGYELTGHWLAAVVGWVAIAFTPPLVWYVFLVYPEMTAGLGLIIAVRHLLAADKSHPARFGLTAFGLASLPWLSAWYLPLLGLLVAWAFIRAWRERERGWWFVGLGSLSGLGSFALFSWWLYGSASPAVAYAGLTPLTFETASAGPRFLRGIVGWLLDNQRGIISASPIYIIALWGWRSVTSAQATDRGGRVVSLHHHAHYGGPVGRLLDGLGIFGAVYGRALAAVGGGHCLLGRLHPPGSRLPGDHRSARGQFLGRARGHAPAAHRHSLQPGVDVHHEPAGMTEMNRPNSYREGKSGYRLAKGWRLWP